MDVFWTAAVGIAGIAAAFFAPPWTSRRIEQRRERRDFRRARRRVANELAVGAEGLSFVVDSAEIPRTEHLSDPRFLPTAAWESEQTVLATFLDEPDWLEVSRAYELFWRMRGLLGELAEEVAEGRLKPALDNQALTRVEQGVEIMAAAHMKLLAAEPLKN